MCVCEWVQAPNTDGCLHGAPVDNSHCVRGAQHLWGGGREVHLDSFRTVLFSTQNDSRPGLLCSSRGAFRVTALPLCLRLFVCGSHRVCVGGRAALLNGVSLPEALSTLFCSSCCLTPCLLQQGPSAYLICIQNFNSTRVTLSVRPRVGARARARGLPA